MASPAHMAKAHTRGACHGWHWGTPFMGEAGVVRSAFAPRLS
jgi:hypothetical protein